MVGTSSSSSSSAASFGSFGDVSVRPAAGGTIKFLCSYGGEILPRYPDGQLRYVGGHTRVLVVDRNLPFSELRGELGEMCGWAVVNLRCQVPTEDLDALVSITSDEDLANLIEEYDLASRDRVLPVKIRAFLFPPPTKTPSPPSTPDKGKKSSTAASARLPLPAARLPVPADRCVPHQICAPAKFAIRPVAAVGDSRFHAHHHHHPSAPKFRRRPPDSPASDSSRPPCSQPWLPPVHQRYFERGRGPGLFPSDSPARPPTAWPPTAPIRPPTAPIRPPTAPLPRSASDSLASDSSHPASDSSAAPLGLRQLRSALTPTRPPPLSLSLPQTKAVHHQTSFSSSLPHQFPRQPRPGVLRAPMHIMRLLRREKP